MSDGERDGFRKAIDGALEILQGYARAVPVAQIPDQPLPGLLAQCRQLVDASARSGPAPIRTLHHLACTGGTLIARCVAAMPNVRLLSEVDPLSTLPRNLTFVPSDVVRLARFGSRPVEQQTEIAIFHAGLEVVRHDSAITGLDLVLRDHSHSLFHLGDTVAERPTLREILAREAALRSLVTVRHPLDSFLSLRVCGWDKHFAPSILDEYARRYHLFLDRHAGLEILRYEDLLAEPADTMRRICDILDLAYAESFLQTFQAIQLSGDSGRGGQVLAPHPRRAVEPDLELQRSTSVAYARLCERLGYES